MSSTLPLGSSSRAAGDRSRFVLLDELDRDSCGRRCERRGGSVGVPESELDLEVGALLCCEIRGNSVGVSE